MSVLVEIRKLSKVYERGKEKIEVLHHVDLDIEKGDFLALMGPSGSGKTTLLNLIGGLDSPTEGTLSVAGKRIDNLGEGALAKWRASNVGFVFQFYNLLPMLSARQNVELPLLLTRLGSAQRKRNAGVALDLVGLSDRAAHKPGELSGGQQQRVAIARAIVSDPTLLVCDEPTGDLDRQSAEEILGLLQQLNREHGKTVIMVTHDPKAAEHARHVFHILIANLFRFFVVLEIELASRQVHPRLVQRGQRHLGVIEIRRCVNPKQHSLILRINEIQVRRTNPLMDVSNQFRKLCFVIEFCNPVEHGLQRSEAGPVDRRLVSARRVVVAHLLLDGRAFRRRCSRLLERLTHGSDVPQGKRIECSPPRLVGRNRIRL